MLRATRLLLAVLLAWGPAAGAQEQAHVHGGDMTEGIPLYDNLGDLHHE